MGPWFDILRRHRVVRASAAAIFLYGFAGAATSPYQSMIAIRELGMSDHGYAALALASSLAYVTMAIGVGMISDRFQSYRRPLIFVRWRCSIRSTRCCSAMSAPIRPASMRRRRGFPTP
jgi:SET family sugar efflux transporter-like MFS transporter